MAAMTAVCVFLGALNGSEIRLHQVGNEVFVATNLTGGDLKLGLHGFHIHEKGDLGQKCMNAGGHYNPENKYHGAPNATEHHKGDLGNFEVTGVDTYKNESFSFFTIQEVIGKAFVVHADVDDLGLGEGDKRNGSLTTGNAGARLDCCLIVSNDPVTTPKPSGGSAPKNCEDQVWVISVLLMASFTRKILEF